MAEITLLLRKWEAGDPDALGELMPLVYPQLRQVAAAYMGREQRKDVMQATVLVHELYLRLLRQKKIEWQDRRHFYVFAARAMRMILIDHARSLQTQTRGSNATQVPLSDDLLWVEIGSPEIIELNRALDELAQLDAEKVRMVEIRYFLGCTTEETAELLGVSKATADRELRFIKTWLYRRLRPDNAAAEDSGS